MKMWSTVGIILASLLIKPEVPVEETAAAISTGPIVSTYENKELKKEIPVLCYHNITSDRRAHPSEYTISVDKFRAQIRMLSDSGYTTVLPDQLYRYIAEGKAVPAKSIMITFDDSHAEHFLTVAPILESFGYRGVFFVMTVTIGKKSYLTREQIKTLSDSGHVIGSHTWDHPNLKRLDEKQWEWQLGKPKATLEAITGRPVTYFAYPFGAWNDNAIRELKKRGIRAAFQLAGKQSDAEPLYTVRRMMVNGNWSASSLYKQIKVFFK